MQYNYENLSKMFQIVGTREDPPGSLKASLGRDGWFCELITSLVIFNWFNPIWSFSTSLPLFKLCNCPNSMVVDDFLTVQPPSSLSQLSHNCLLENVWLVDLTADLTLVLNHSGLDCSLFELQTPNVPIVAEMRNSTTAVKIESER